MSDYSEIVLADAPIGYWRCDDPSGDLLDSSGANRTATKTGGNITYQIAPLIANDTDKALQCDTVEGANSFSCAAYPTSYPNGCAIELWFMRYADGGRSTGTLFELGDIALRLDDYQSNLGGARLSVIVSGTIENRVAYNETHHLVVNFKSNSERKIYLNNVVLFSQPITAALTYNIIRMLYYLTTTVTDEIALYDKPLTPAQVAAHYYYGTGAWVRPRGASRKPGRPVFNPAIHSIHATGV